LPTEVWSWSAGRASTRRLRLDFLDFLRKALLKGFKLEALK
jgi:hypothetical protein